MVIHGLQKLTLLDYPGHTACTVFTAHCPWRCPFCHNASLVLEPESQPVIPEEAQRVIMVIGIDGAGKTIRETCHRSALYAQLAGVDEETVVTPQLAARVVNAEGYGDRVYINKVESAADYEAAQAMANEFSCPVIAGSLHQGVYVCLH